MRSFPWSALPAMSADLLAVMFVTITTFLLNTTGIEIATRHEADVERDLKVLGLANIVSGAFGGYVSCTSLSRSIIVRGAGATSRVAGLTVAAVSLGVLVRSVIHRLCAQIRARRTAARSRCRSGLSMADPIVATAAPLEYLSLLAIAALIIYSGFIAGVLIGIVIGCATFALSASRVSAIKFDFDGMDYRSSLDRGPYELSLLAEHGGKIQGIALQSYLFFGSANQLYQRVKLLLAKQPECRFLVFDFRLVTGIDSSATHSFAQIKQAAAASGARLVLVNLAPELERSFHTARLIASDVITASDLDRALEACEENVIEAHRTEADDARSLRAWLADALGSVDHADGWAPIAGGSNSAGDIIARQGDAGRTRCISFSKAASASLSSSATAAPCACAASVGTPRSAKWD